MLERDEYIEQAYLFRSLLERIDDNASVQDLLQSIREELLSTTNLPKAVDFLSNGGFNVLSIVVELPRSALTG